MTDTLTDRCLVELMDFIRIYDRDNVESRRPGDGSVLVKVTLSKMNRVRGLIQEVQAARKAVPS